MEQELDQRLHGEAETGEKYLRAPEQDCDALEVVASTSDSSVRHEKSGYDELPKEMNDMKIKDDRTGDHVENAKVGF